MSKNQTFILMGSLATLGLAGCAAVSRPNPEADFQALMQAGFRGEGIASVERLKQDPSQQACSGVKLPDSQGLKAIREAAQQSIQPPADGQYLGDWKQGEKLAQDGRGMTWTDKTAESKANGAGCYNCHQLSEEIGRAHV
jgi:sulfur-oxidizing protein SoxX